MNGGYLDPGGGGMLLQILFGGAAGILVVIKLYGRKILNRFRPAKTTEPEKPAAVSSVHDP